MASSAWKGYISFGLVSVPIRLYPAARSSHVAFHEIHRKCGHRVHQQLYCPYDKEVVSRDEIALGYEIEKDKYVLVDPGELKNLQLPSSTAMEIVQFVKLSEVDPIYFETSYFVVPEQAGPMKSIRPRTTEKPRREISRNRRSILPRSLPKPWSNLSARSSFATSMHTV
jgi:DNA end-binding protein Ku